MGDLSKIFSALDLDLRNSEPKKAQAELIKLSRLKISGADAITFASLCSRAGIPGLGFAKLRPIVRPLGRKKAAASPEHRIEFAACLVRLGAYRDAESILSEISTEAYPEVLKTQALLHIREWNYPVAIPLFQKYIAAIPRGSYASTINKLNLTLSLIFEERLNEAAEILNEIVTTKENFQYPLLEANCYRAYGVLEINRGNYEVAMQCLLKAHATFGDPNGLDAFLVRKWIAITQYSLQKGSAVAKILLDSLLQEAVVRKHWESIRDIDFHVASFHQNEELLVRLYFGTSYARFKERLQKRFPSLVIPKTYHWQLGKGTSGKNVVFDPDASSLKPGQAPYRMFSILISDFYRAFNTIDLFQGVYPGELYSYGHSEHKIRQLTNRVRKEFLAEGQGIEINHADGAFSLASTSPIQVLIRQKNTEVLSVTDHRMAQLKAHFAQNSFSVTDVISVLSVARATANEILKSGLDRKELIRTGSGKKTKYFIPNSSQASDKKAA